jgi:hypothetical protein
VAKADHFTAAELTFGVLHEQLVLLQCVQDEAHVLKMLSPRAAVDEDVIEEDKYEDAVFSMSAVSIHT